LVYPLKIRVIFHSHLSLPEGNEKDTYCLSDLTLHQPSSFWDAQGIVDPEDRNVAIHARWIKVVSILVSEVGLYFITALARLLVEMIMMMMMIIINH
jgi:hypothetical protein